MSTVFPAPRPEADATATRRRRWLLAITAWAGFIGASLTLALGIVLLPDEATAALGWHELSVAFLCAWLLSMLTVGFALSLALPLVPAGKDSRPTGRHDVPPDAVGRQSIADTAAGKRHGR